MEQYNVTGMSCAACSARVEKAVSKVEGVTACSVSLLTNSMVVEGSASTESIVQAVMDAGYHASKSSPESAKQEAEQDALSDKETPLLKKRLFASLGFLALLMYISMGHMMWNWPLPTFLGQNPMMLGLAQLVLTIIVMVINQQFFIRGFTSLLHRAPNMDTLVALGSGAGFLYSLYGLFAMADVMYYGNMDAAMGYLHDFYFESSAMIVTLITVGKMLEARSKGKTTDALKGLMQLAPKTAVLIKDGKEVEVTIEQVRVNDVFVVRPGEYIPVDGEVINGHSAVNESALTGESIPVDKAEGNSVSAATLNQSGFLQCRATRVGQDTTLAQIIQMVQEASATKAPIAKIADKVSGIFVPTVITIAVITTIIWLLAGESIGFALARGISVLVISCPCALGLATPVAIMVGTGVGAKNGILFKTAVSLEKTGKVQVVALDKTGTITNGTPVVTDIIPLNGISKETLFSYAYSLEQHSEHPLAKAVLEYKDENLKIACLEVSDFEALPGNGLKAICENQPLYGGNATFIRELVQIPDSVLKQVERLSEQGKTPLFFAKDKTLLGIIAVADTLKEDSITAIKELKNLGIHVVMLTGDNEKTANAIGTLAGVDAVIAGVLPEGKEAAIRELQQRGTVAMVGDGINDAPALIRADIGIAIGTGTDIAVDAADIVLMKSRLTDVAAAIRLSKGTIKNIKENLFWAFIYNIIGIPLAAGIWIPIFGWQLNPMFGAAAMSLSSFCVVTNALRLNLLKIYDSKKGKKIKEKKMEEEKMTVTMNIEGMMCGHCEARVKKCLEGIPQVAEAVVSHEAGTAVVTLKETLDQEVLKKTVEDQDYKVISIC